MGISIKDFLYQYFDAEQLKDPLSDIGIPFGKSKDERVTRILENWPARNRKWGDLLDYLKWDDLAEICEDFNLEYYDDDDEDALIKQIKKAQILVPMLNNKKSDNHVEDSPQTSNKKLISHKTIMTIIGIIATLVGGGLIVSFNFDNTTGENVINKSPNASINIGQDFNIVNEGTLIIGPENPKSDSDIIPYEEIWQTYRDDRDYFLTFTDCSFNGKTSSIGEVSWEFSMKPIMINKENKPALIPFNISYRFHYEGLSENGWQSLRSALPESSQKHSLDFKEIDTIYFSQITSALNEAETKNFTKVRIIKDRTSFNPYAPSIDDNLLDMYIRNETTLNVTQIEYDEEAIENVEKWKQGYLKDSICDNLYSQ